MTSWGEAEWQKQNNTSRYKGEEKRHTGDPATSVIFSGPEKTSFFAQHTRRIWKMLVGWCLRTFVARLINAQQKKNTFNFLFAAIKVFFLIHDPRPKKQARIEINWQWKPIEIPLHSDEIITRAEIICRSAAWAATNDDEHLFMLILRSFVCCFFSD